MFGTSTRLHFEYDYRNHLRRVSDDQDRTVAAYEYDGLNRRVRKTTLDAEEAVTSDVWYLWSGWQCVEERDLNTAGQPVLRQHVYGPGYVDHHAALVDSQGAKYYYLQDRMANVVALADSTGAVVERYAYEPYGGVTITDETGQTVRGASAYGNAYTFTGRYWDAEAGLYYFRNRWYSPDLGRFTSRDPMGYVDGASMYAYAVASPARLADAMGLATCGPDRYDIDWGGGGGGSATEPDPDQGGENKGPTTTGSYEAMILGAGQSTPDPNKPKGGKGGTVAPDPRIVPGGGSGEYIYGVDTDWSLWGDVGAPALEQSALDIVQGLQNAAIGLGNVMAQDNMPNSTVMKWAMDMIEACADMADGDTFTTALANAIADQPGHCDPDKLTWSDGMVLPKLTGWAKTSNHIGRDVLGDVILMAGIGEAAALAKGAKAATGATKVASKAGEVPSSVAKAVTQGHHPWAKYLGGPAKQQLEKLPVDLHQKYHSGLDRILPRQKGGDFYRKLPGNVQAENFEAFRKYTEAFDKQHGTQLWEAIKKTAGAK